MKAGEQMLTEQARQARREYKRQWAKRNPDKIRAQQERHWERKAAAEHREELPPDLPPEPQQGEETA